MTKKVLTSEQQIELDKIKTDLENDRNKEISHNDVLKWMERARKQTFETFPAFIQEINDTIPLSYGNICHMIGIAAIASAYTFENSDKGGITGFQSGCILWDIVCAWTNNYEPQKMIHFRDMLYPQMDYKFSTISKETFRWLQKEAQKELSDSNDGIGMHPDVTRHMKSIVAGEIPFGYTLEG